MLETESWQKESDSVQCHVGSKSVKTEMKVCCASKTPEKETNVAWRNCAQPKLPMYLSMVSSRDLGGSEFESVRSGRVGSAMNGSGVSTFFSCYCLAENI